MWQRMGCHFLFVSVTYCSYLTCHLFSVFKHLDSLRWTRQHRSALNSSGMIRLVPLPSNNWGLRVKVIPSSLPWLVVAYPYEGNGTVVPTTTPWRPMGEFMYKSTFIGAQILFGRCPSLSAHESESMLRTYVVCRQNIHRLAACDVGSCSPTADEFDWDFSSISHNSCLLTSH
jgi:hypothetical protein